MLNAALGNAICVGRRAEHIGAPYAFLATHISSTPTLGQNLIDLVVCAMRRSTATLRSRRPDKCRRRRGAVFRGSRGTQLGLRESVGVLPGRRKREERGRSLRVELLAFRAWGPSGTWASGQARSRRREIEIKLWSSSKLLWDSAKK